MTIHVVAVGRIRERDVRSVADDYVRRIGRYVKLEEREVRDASQLLRAIPRDAHVVCMEVDGRAMTSTELSSHLEELRCQRKGDVAFVIGGADGIGSDVRAISHETLSLSRMTLPHRLARVVLLEQVYRALTIARGEPYAREE